MRYDRNSQRLRRGTTAVQVALLLGVIALVAIPSIAALGRATSDYLNETSAGVADPSKLTGRFGGGDSSNGSGGGSTDAGGDGGSDGDSGDAGSSDGGSSDSDSGDTGGAPSSGKKKKKSGKRK